MNNKNINRSKKEDNYVSESEQDLPIFCHYCTDGLFYSMEPYRQHLLLQHFNWPYQNEELWQHQSENEQQDQLEQQEEANEVLLQRESSNEDVDMLQPNQEANNQQNLIGDACPEHLAQWQQTFSEFISSMERRVIDCINEEQALKSKLVRGVSQELNDFITRALRELYKASRAQFEESQAALLNVNQRMTELATELQLQKGMQNQREDEGSVQQPAVQAAHHKVNQLRSNASSSARSRAPPILNPTADDLRRIDYLQSKLSDSFSDESEPSFTVRKRDKKALSKGFAQATSPLRSVQSSSSKRLKLNQDSGALGLQHLDKVVEEPLIERIQRRRAHKALQLLVDKEPEFERLHSQLQWNEYEGSSQQNGDLAKVKYMERWMVPEDEFLKMINDVVKLAQLMAKNRELTIEQRRTLDQLKTDLAQFGRVCGIRSLRFVKAIGGMIYLRKKLSGSKKRPQRLMTVKVACRQDAADKLLQEYVDKKGNDDDQEVGLCFIHHNEEKHKCLAVFEKPVKGEGFRRIDDKQLRAKLKREDVNTEHRRKEMREEIRP